MKIEIKLFLTLAILLVIASCRKEEYIVDPKSEIDSLKKESLVSNLIQRTTLKDGSIDNIIDQASCLTVNLPVALLVNGNSIVINTPQDYQTIKNIYNASSSDTDSLVITYPITITLENYSEVIINSDSELYNYRNTCVAANEVDDDIECIDFDYPIRVTTYNKLTDKLGATSLENDKELYEFINEIEDYLVVNISFPITATLYDGTFVTLNNLEELQLEIENVVNACDEDDDYDYNDDDETENHSENEFKALLTQCDWKIDELEANDQHVENQFTGFKFTFNADGSATAINSSGTIYNGTWSVSSNSGLRLTIQFNDFTILSHTWRLKEINPEDNGTEVKLKNEEDELKIKQACP